MNQDGTCPYCKREDIELIPYGYGFKLRACKSCLIQANAAVVREIDFYRSMSHPALQKRLKKNVRRDFGSRVFRPAKRGAS